MRIKKIIISRTDSIGDVILTLPVAGLLKKIIPGCEINFLGNSYTREIAESSVNIDNFIDWSELKKQNSTKQINYIKSIQSDAIIHVFPVKEISHLAVKAGIPLRIGSTGRIYHYLTCNKLVPLSRQRSNLHEAQLNLKLIKPLEGQDLYSLQEIQENYGIKVIAPLSESIKIFLTKDKFNLILHPKSKGSAREWGLSNFSQLINLLPEDKFRIFITGTEQEGEIIRKELIAFHPQVIDMTGKLSLKQLVSFISETDGMVSASTGPLHIAAALGKIAIGIYPPIEPMHPGRWAPIGENADYIVKNKQCSDCRKKSFCECMESITPEAVYDKLLSKILNHE
jgi:heptosyltransferase III